MTFSFIQAEEKNGEASGVQPTPRHCSFRYRAMHARCCSIAASETRKHCALKDALPGLIAQAPTARILLSGPSLVVCIVLIPKYCNPCAYDAQYPKFGQS